MNDDEQQPDRPPGVNCPNCLFHIDCEMATQFIQAEVQFRCPNCFFDLTELTDHFKAICSSASNK